MTAPGTIEIPVLYRGTGYAVIDKPSGLAVVAERPRPGVTPLLDAIAGTIGSPEILVVHRLDRETSGALVVATEPEAHRALSMQFARHEVEKTYLAIVRGEVYPDDGLVQAPIERAPRGGSLMRVAIEPADGPRRRTGTRRRQAATTQYLVRERFRGLTLLEVSPRTGRQHQIRVHLRHAGYPLAVDPLYGAAALYLSEFKRGYKPGRSAAPWETGEAHGGRAEAPLLARLSLHAWRLRLRDPFSGAEVRVEAPLPKDFARALELLRKYAARERRRRNT